MMEVERKQYCHSCGSASTETELRKTENGKIACAICVQDDELFEHLEPLYVSESIFEILERVKQSM